MKVLVAAPYAINTPHYETALELIQLHLDRDDDVVMLQCDAAMVSCDANPSHAFSGCAQCVYRRHAGLRLLSTPIRTASVYRLTADDRRCLEKLQLDFADIEELKRYEVDGFDLGYGVLSSLISLQRSSVPDLRESHTARLMRHLLLASYAVFRSFRNHLADEKPDRVYVYNGRYASTRAVLRACQQAGVECLVHEVGSTIQRYALFRNHLPYELRYAEQLIREAWSHAQDTPEERERLATEFYENQSRGIVPTWFSFTAQQQRELLPDGWDASRTNIAIFNSSDDEFAAYSDEWRLPFYASQLDGLRQILASLGNDERFRVYLRVHPNLRQVRDRFTAELARLSANNFVLIPADSPVSTYAVLHNADKVVTFGSSIGIEATYWGKPSILAGVSMYRNLGATYNPASHAELVALLHADLRPMPREGALMYGFHRRTFGIPFKYFRARGVFEGEFKSVRLHPGLLVRGLSLGAQLLGLGWVSRKWHDRRLGLNSSALR